MSEYNVGRNGSARCLLICKEGSLNMRTLGSDCESILGFMASFPPRRDTLEVSVASILPQVDRLFIYLNGYDHVPGFLEHEKIVAVPAHDLEDLRDVGKLYCMPEAPQGFYLTLDDDIFYPANYSENLVAAAERYGRRALVGVHGVILDQSDRRYFTRGRMVHCFWKELESDVPVNVVGTGTMCFHSSTISLKANGMPKGMLDIGVALSARQAMVPMVVVAREESWLQPLKVTGGTLYGEFCNNDEEHARLLESQPDWSILSP